MDRHEDGGLICKTSNIAISLSDVASVCRQLLTSNTSIIDHPKAHAPCCVWGVG